MKKIAVIGVPGGWSSEGLADVVAAKTGNRWLVDLKHVALDLESGRVSDGRVDLHTMDALIIKKAGSAYSPHLLDRLEMLRYVAARGVKVFSDPLRIIRSLDRMSCTVTLAAAGIPMPPTAVTEDADKALAFVEVYGKAVFKPLYSTKARGMEVIERGPDAKDRILEFKAANPVLYVQRLVDHPGKDLGVAFLGGEYLATYARAGAKGAWNTTTRAGGAYEPHTPTPEIIALAQKAQDLFQLDFTCVDVVETPDGAKVFEVSAFGGFRGLHVACGVDAAERYVEYVLARC